MQINGWTRIRYGDTGTISKCKWEFQTNPNRAWLEPYFTYSTQLEIVGMEVSLSEIRALGIEGECIRADNNWFESFNLRVGAVKTDELSSGVVGKAFYPGVQRRKENLGTNCRRRFGGKS